MKCPKYKQINKHINKILETLILKNRARYYFFLVFIFFFINPSCSNNTNWTKIINATKESVVTIGCGNSLGSGFFIEDSILVTNFHVVSSYKNYLIKIKIINEDDLFDGEVIAYAKPPHDLALLHIKDFHGTPLRLEKEFQQGEEIIVIGTPEDLELESTVSKGLVSAIRKFEDPNITLIQVDAAVNSGNSGGPVINKKGHVVGVATLKFSGVGVEGLSFGISSTHVKQLIKREIGTWIGKDEQSWGTLLAFGKFFLILVFICIIISFIIKKNSESNTDKVKSEVPDDEKRSSTDNNLQSAKDTIASIPKRVMQVFKQQKSAADQPATDDNNFSQKDIPKQTIESKEETHVKKKISVVKKDKSILHAVLDEDVHQVIKLLEKGIDPNTEDESGDTGLHIAIQLENQQVAKCLLDYGAIATIENNSGETSFDVAKNNNYKQLFELLKKYNNLKL